MHKQRNAQTMPNDTPPQKPKEAKRSAAVALKEAEDTNDLATVIASGRGKFAEQLLQIAFERGIKVREDSALAEILTALEEDSPIPTEAFAAVSEILSYLYKADGRANPFSSDTDDDINTQ